MKSQTVFRSNKNGQPIFALGHVRIRASSDDLGWNGLQLEVGSNHGWDVDDLMIDGHQIGINLASTTLHLKTRNESEADWNFSSMPPLTFWINPEGRPFSLHHNQDSYWASCIIDGRFLDDVAGRHYVLNGGYGIVDDVLAHLIQAIIANLHDQQNYSKELVAALIRTFVYTLVKRHGSPAAETSAKGGIAPTQLKSLLSWLELHVGDSLTVELMAAQVGLSAAHFSREFKRSTGLTPWGYFVQLRLESARKLIEAGESISRTALQTGFSDQSHLSRLFKLRYGVSPSVYVKSMNVMT